jgi:hypothetical protein
VIRAAACFAVVAMVAALAACHTRPDDTPEGALSAFVTAMNASRTDITARERAYEMLAAPARASLAARAQRASQLSGYAMQPWEMLAPGRFAMRFTFDPDGLSARIEGERAVVTARGPAGDRAEVPMVREGGRWRVALGLPPVEPIRIGDAGAR